MTKEKLLENIREMIADNWKNSDLDARTEKILAFIAENDYEGRDEDLEAFIDRINSARTETPALFIVQDALKNEGWNFEKAMCGLVRFNELSEEAKKEAYNRFAWDFVNGKPKDKSHEEIMAELNKHWFDKNGATFLGTY